MRVADLRAFLSELAPALRTLHVADAGLAAAAGALAPFDRLSTDELAGYIARVEAAGRQAGVAVVEPPGVAAVTAAAADLNAAIRGDGTPDPTALRDSLVRLGAAFGMAVTVKEPTGWASGVRAAALARAAAAGVNAPEGVAAADVAGLVEAGDPALKAAAGVLGVAAGRKKGVELARALVAAAAGVDLPAPAKSGRAKPPPVDTAGLVAELKALADRAAADPHAVTAAETDAAVARMEALPATAQKAVAKAVTGSPGKNGEEAVLRVRGKIAGVREAIDSQKV